MTTNRDQLKAKLERMRDRESELWQKHIRADDDDHVPTYGAGFDAASEMLLDAMEALERYAEFSPTQGWVNMGEDAGYDAREALAKIMAKVEE